MKQVLLSFAALALSSGAMAQVSIGAKAGVNYNIWSVAEGDQFPTGADKPESSSGIGFHLGGYMEYAFSDNLAFRPELLFSTHGVKDDLDETYTETDIFGNSYTVSTTGESKVNASYLEVPLLLAYKPSEAFGIHFGPVVAFRMGFGQESEGTSSTTIGGQTTSTSFSSDTSEDTGVQGLDFGLAAGFAYELESGLNFGFRYCRSLTTTNDDSENGVLGSTDFIKINQNVLQVSVGYTFMKD